MDYLIDHDLKINSIEDVRRLEETPASELSIPSSTYDLIRAGGKKWPDRIALRFLPSAEPNEESVTFTYRELSRKVTQTANALHALGVEKDDCVSMLLPNLPETMFTIWGAEATAIFNPINPMLEVEHIAAILNEAKSKVLVTLAPAASAELWAKASVLQELVPSLDYILTVGGGGQEGEDSHLSASVLNFNDAIADQPDDQLISGRIIRGSDIASYFHTGGTTGTPKLAPHTHYNELISSYQIACAAGLTPDSIGLCGLPLFHVNGVFVTGLAPWMMGGQAILATAAGYRTPAVLQNFWALVEKYQISYFSCVPTILSVLSEVPVADHDLSSLDCAFCGAAPLATELFRKFENLTGLKLIEGYGQTEGTTASTVNPKHGDRRVGSVGIPLPYLRLRIVEVDDSGKAVRDCAVSEAGVVAISGENVFSGYKQPEQNEGQWVEEGWFNTGDLGRLDEDGYLWLTGRSKDLIIRGGHNIDPLMIEEAYYEHEGVSEAAAIGKPDKRAGELPVVVVQLKEGVHASKEELLAWGRDHIHERAAVPKEVHIIDDMPLTAVGKIFKPELRNALIHDQVTLELLSVLDHPFSVDVRLDKKHGQRVEVKAPAACKADILDTLSGYAFQLQLEVQDQ